jgi:hypothetical protein
MVAPDEVVLDWTLEIVGGKAEKAAEIVVFDPMENEHVLPETVQTDEGVEEKTVEYPPDGTAVTTTLVPNGILPGHAVPPHLAESVPLDPALSVSV